MRIISDIGLPEHNDNGRTNLWLGSSTLMTYFTACYMVSLDPVVNLSMMMYYFDYLTQSQFTSGGPGQSSTVPLLLLTI